MAAHHRRRFFRIHKEGIRRRQFEFDRLAREGMDELQTAGEKQQAVGLLFRVAVLVIAKNGMADAGELHANLRPTAGFDGERKERGFFAPFQHPVMGDRFANGFGITGFWFGR